MRYFNSLFCTVVCGSLFFLTAGSLAAAAGTPVQAPARDPMHSSLQMVVVTVPGWSAVDGSMVRYQRSGAGKRWERVGEPITIVVGKSGMGWGTGLIPADLGAVREAAEPVKKEGDGKSPAGIFRIGTAFGSAAQAPGDWKLSYIRLTPTVECVDDPASKFYNRIVDRSSVAADWNSSEHMLAVGAAYRWGAVIQNNADPVVPGAGSCVFLHIWSGAGKGTAGCTAMPATNLESLLAWIDPAANPILVQLPEADYQRLRKPWGLPKAQ